MLPGDEFYLSAFWDLDTTRNIGMAVGPIPWHHIVTYGERHELDEEALDLFIHVIRCMDQRYMEIQAKELDKKTKK